MKNKNKANKKNTSAVIVTESVKSAESQSASLKKEEVQNFTVFLPKEFHRRLKIYSIANDEQMGNILLNIIRRGAEVYKKDNPEFPAWEQ
ncbi:MAG: hypothetical protein KH813_00225 [Negativicoccus succinicivorans]|uniref:hypothetical protein n=1 Tax=Negativicoccus succinicivorans TaxID=620903 RepID=UPI0026F11E6E|nr:hypothetical protein [Negativicoccus succinicivorans]MBS6027834.1 hypothetical protein [Negativicoccus succinicivorans]